MKKYGLFLKNSDEIIYLYVGDTMDKAILFFSSIKNLESNKLLSIYDVKKISEMEFFY